ncbi:MAG: leucyl aminopeptidase [Planctomycetota bacterium]|nr:leucyl aminopeptidase [Planctomycetota bacterium]
MRILLKSDVLPSRDELHAFLIPAKTRFTLPEAAPPSGQWKQDFPDKPGSQLLLHGPGGKRWLLLRVPAPRESQPEDFRVAAATARLKAEGVGVKNLLIDFSFCAKNESWLRAAAEGAAMAGYDHGILKEDRSRLGVRRCTLAGASVSASARRAVKAGEMGASANLFARELQNLPANLLTPRNFASRARKVCAGHAQLSVKVLTEKVMDSMGMGSLLGVSQGSAEPAQLVHMVYRPKGKSKGKLALVGKGLTFDTGGISLKSPANMWDMKFDMSGAAAVLGVFHALSKGADCPFEVHGILGCVENMPGGKAQRPGDIVTAMNGKTIEIHSTDAEGRLVLADCLTYTARKVKPDCIYDMATLTGAAIHALGRLNSAVIGTDQKAIDALRDSAETAGESFWQLPITEEYKDLTRGTYADLQNGYDAGQGAGTIAGACFLSFFVEDVPWVHLDIAATAWQGPSKPYFSAKGGRGVAARTMLEVIRG